MSDGTTRVDPPLGGPWDSPLASAPLAFVDLEMTGLDPAHDRVIEVFVRRREDGAERSLGSLVRPEPFVHRVGVHGIEASALLAAPTFGELWPRLEPLLRGAVLVGHAAEHDVAFLLAELARLPEEARGHAAWSAHYLDTLRLSRRARRRGSHSLAALASERGIDPSTLHRAEADVGALVAVFDELVRELDAKTPRDLWHVRVGERAARPEVMAALERALAANPQAFELRYRPSGRAAETLSYVVTGLRADLDPPRVLGYLVPSRARRELRADRILAVGQATGAPSPGLRIPPPDRPSS